MLITYPLLVHEPRIGAVIHNFLSKNRCSELPVNVFSVEIGMLAVQDKVIALGSKKHRRRFTKQDERKAISILRSAIEEELIRINTILDGATGKRKDVKNDWGAMRIWEPYLSNNVGDNR